MHSSSVPPPFGCVEPVAWTKHEPHTPMLERDSKSTTSSNSSGNILIPRQKEDMLYYAAQVLVLIPLPSSQAWVPTFHSCLISRYYTINLSLTIRTPRTGVPVISMSL